MSLNDPNLPPDPFSEKNSPDMTAWAANCRAMYTGLVATGFKESESLEITIRCMQAMMSKVVS